MSELKIGSRWIDKFHGVIIVVDPDWPGRIKFEIERSGHAVYRTAQDVQLMRKAPRKNKAATFIGALVFLIGIGLICLVTIILASKVVIYSQEGVNPNEPIHIESQKKQAKQADN